MLLKKPQRIRDARYLKFVRECGCVLTLPEKEMACSSVDVIDAHRVKPVGGGILGSKVSDYRAVGLCRLHHQMSESYPATYRDILEAAIRKLNKEYSSLFPAKPTRERKRSARVQHLLILCECGKVHRMPASKTQLSSLAMDFTHAGIQYHCPFLRKDLIASFRRSA